MTTAGLLAGALAWLGSDDRVIGAEPPGAASIALTLDAAGPPPAEVDPFMDGAAVRQAARTRAIAATYRPRLVAVPEGRI